MIPKCDRFCTATKRFPPPTLVCNKLHGSCDGFLGGFEVALGCHWRVASSRGQVPWIKESFCWEPFL